MKYTPDLYSDTRCIVVQVLFRATQCSASNFASRVAQSQPTFTVQIPIVELQPSSRDSLRQPCMQLQGNIRADGADEDDAALFLARAAAEEAISNAEAAQGRGDQVGASQGCLKQCDTWIVSGLVKHESIQEPVVPKYGLGCSGTYVYK